MLIDRKVERYAMAVASYVPAPFKSRAEKDVSDMIYDMINDYADGKEPDILDAREVISSLGSPEDIALRWMTTYKDRSRERGEMKELTVFGFKVPELQFLTGEKTRRYLASLMNVFTMLSIVLILFGVLGLGTHVIRTMLPVFTGCVLALLSLTGRGVLIRQY